jgi:hypothetical protein
MKVLVSKGAFFRSKWYPFKTINAELPLERVNLFGSKVSRHDFLLKFLGMMNHARIASRREGYNGVVSFYFCVNQHVK